MMYIDSDIFSEFAKTLGAGIVCGLTLGGVLYLLSYGIARAVSLIKTSVGG